MLEEDLLNEMHNIGRLSDEEFISLLENIIHRLQTRTKLIKETIKYYKMESK